MARQSVGASLRNAASTPQLGGREMRPLRPAVVVRRDRRRNGSTPGAPQEAGTLSLRRQEHTGVESRLNDLEMVRFLNPAY
ncbi:hypothetical protein NDU88_007517 [Pleurodeles waltl]|uniref:Uncharacterized protein n=1 Tax=Pleurodeles waltl TaxID=8319 RepID=A0AAV7QPA8_PLEWA|nr:hypothetical protein NDU88_007517 [Pleurodeles waltl]